MKPRKMVLRLRRRLLFSTLVTIGTSMANGATSDPGVSHDNSGWCSGRPSNQALTELRQLADDLTDLGDSATAALVRQAIDRFMAWKFEAGERLLQYSRCSPSPCAPVAIRHYYAPMLKAHWKGSR